MDKFLVRLLPILLNLYITIVIALSFAGIDISTLDYWFSSSITMGVLLTVLCHTQGRYHCKWIRLLCYNLIFVPLLGFIDSIWPLFYSVEEYIFTLCIEMSVVILLTIGLALHHFIKARRVIKQKRYAEIKSIQCGRPRED